MPTPMTVTFRKKSNADLLSYLQGEGYTTLTAVILNLDGSITFEASDTISGPDLVDIQAIIASEQTWEQV